MSLYREDLDASGCATPNCGHDHSELFFHGKCHMDAPSIARYVKTTGTVEIECAECNRPIASVKVASHRHCNCGAGENAPAKAHARGCLVN
jgi:hypothetical protein